MYEWVPVSGRGTVWSVTIPHPPLLPAYSEVAPYNVCSSQLDEDPDLRLVGNVVASADAPLNSIDPHSVEIGERGAGGLQPGRRHVPPPLGPRLSHVADRGRPHPRSFASLHRAGSTANDRGASPTTASTCSARPDAGSR